MEKIHRMLITTRECPFGRTIVRQCQEGKNQDKVNCRLGWKEILIIYFIYHRPSPHKESLTWSKPKGSGGASSFQDFQDSVRDAWDIGDDEFNVMSTGMDL